MMLAASVSRSKLCLIVWFVPRPLLCRSELTAALCGAEADLYPRLIRFARDTPDRWALTDLYDATNASRIKFEGRAQMGGFGATLVRRAWPRGLLTTPLLRSTPLHAV